MKYQIYFTVVVLLLLFLSCSENIIKPKDLISTDKMAEIIYEVSLINAAKGVSKKKLEDNGISPTHFIYEKYGIDSLQFVSSLDYYANDIDTYDNIYTTLERRIIKEKERIEALIRTEKEASKNGDEKEKSEIRQFPTEKKSDVLNLKDKNNGFDEFGLKVEGLDIDFQKLKIFKLTRTSRVKPAYARVKPKNIKTSDSIEISVFVKKGENDSAFGLRVTGVYPNRVDALFDLKKGELKGTKVKGYFENETASIILVDKNWYHCKLKVKANINQVKIVFGPTDINKPINGWELKANNLTPVYTTIPILTIK